MSVRTGKQGGLAVGEADVAGTALSPGAVLRLKGELKGTLDSGRGSEDTMVGTNCWIYGA